MIITKQHLATIAQRFLQTLEEEKINSLESVIAAIGTKIKIREMRGVVGYHAKLLAKFPFVATFNCKC